MPIASLKSGYKASYESKIEDKDGSLVVAMRTLKSPLFQKWDAFRVQYCTTHRRAKLPYSYRAGKLDIYTLFYGIYLMVKGEKCKK